MLVLILCVIPLVSFPTMHLFWVLSLLLLLLLLLLLIKPEDVERISVFAQGQRKRQRQVNVSETDRQTEQQLIWDQRRQTWSITTHQPQTNPDLKSISQHLNSCFYVRLLSLTEVWISIWEVCCCRIFFLFVLTSVWSVDDLRALTKFLLFGVTVIWQEEKLCFYTIKPH